MPVLLTKGPSIRRKRTHKINTLYKKEKYYPKKLFGLKFFQEIKIKSISCNKLFSATTIKYPNKYKWKLSLTPFKASIYSLTFKSSNPKIAKVNKTGVITPLRKGTVTVHAYTSNKKIKISKKFYIKIPVKSLKTPTHNITMPYGSSRTDLVN